ncbi:MAG: SAM-dependent methyltransferase [Deltaproteobacteria bacterium RBG_13_43_22]|nr:MAG: SAM-dependent methyltransferase [Deltaproteobacteria bacterium RBG_13_43_22]
MDPDILLKSFVALITEKDLEGPVLDLACGRGQNGLFLAGLGLPVVLADRNPEALRMAKEAAKRKGRQVTYWEIDLETGQNSLKEDQYRAMVVFRYLHRPLIPFIKKAIKGGGILIYETYTSQQTLYSRPHNPDHLLEPRELFDWFKDWEVVHYFEGTLEHPRRSVAQLVCRKPFHFPVVRKI